VTRRRYFRERLEALSGALFGRRSNPPASAEEGGVKVRIANSTYRAVKAYRPRMFPGRIHLFIPNQAMLRHDYGRTRTWLNYAKQGGQLHVGPDGCAGDTLLREPFVGTIAGILSAIIEQESARPSRSRPARYAEIEKLQASCSEKR